jgi:hypothetical protein
VSTDTDVESVDSVSVLVDLPVQDVKEIVAIAAIAKSNFFILSLF